jgi:hypothetical protein
MRTSSETARNKVKDSAALARSSLATAKDIALSRHVLADDFAILKAELVSGGEFTLLDDLEALHTELGDLEHVRMYVCTMQEALRRRYDQYTSLK